MEQVKVLFLLFLLIFLIGCKNNENIEKIDYGNLDNKSTVTTPDGSSFKTKLQDKEFKSEENIYLSLEKFLENNKFEEKYREFRNAMFYCLILDKCIGEKQNYIDYINYLENGKNLEKFSIIKLDLENETETMSTLDKINTKRILKQNFEKYFYNKDFDKSFEEYLKFSDKKYFKTSLDKELDKLGYLMAINRELKYKIFYLLKNGEEDKAIKMLEKQFNIIMNILNGDSYHIEITSSIGLLGINFSYLEIALEKFDLKEKNKKLLKNILETKFNSDEIITNSIKIEYLHLEKVLQRETKNNKDFEKYKNYLKKIYKKILEQKGNFTDKEIENFEKYSFGKVIIEPYFEPYENINRLFEKLKK